MSECTFKHINSCYGVKFSLWLGGKLQVETKKSVKNKIRECFNKWFCPGLPVVCCLPRQLGGGACHHLCHCEERSHASCPISFKSCSCRWGNACLDAQIFVQQKKPVFLVFSVLGFNVFKPLFPRSNCGIREAGLSWFVVSDKRLHEWLFFEGSTSVSPSPFLHLGEMDLMAFLATTSRSFYSVVRE